MSQNDADGFLAALAAGGLPMMSVCDLEALGASSATAVTPTVDGWRARAGGAVDARLWRCRRGAVARFMVSNLQRTKGLGGLRDKRSDGYVPQSPRVYLPTATVPRSCDP